MYPFYSLTERKLRKGWIFIRGDPCEDCSRDTRERIRLGRRRKIILYRARIFRKRQKFAKSRYQSHDDWAHRGQSLPSPGSGTEKKKARARRNNPSRDTHY